jgi:hypothetical protein
MQSEYGHLLSLKIQFMPVVGKILFINIPFYQIYKLPDILNRM